MTNGTGWIPVNFAAMSAGSPFALLPVDPVNSTSSNLYYTYLTDGAGNWKVFSQMESAKYLATAQADGGTLPSSLETGSNLALADYAFPSGWIQVPGNGTFGKSNFWVMQYDAKCVNAATNQPLTSPDTGYQTYSDSSGGAACTSANGNYIASAQSGYPEANVSQTTAASYCASIGAHLITNAEWQTIAWNAENQGVNWSSGIVGTGNVSRGNTDSSWAQSDGNAEGLAGSTSTHQSDFTHLRTLTLSNSSTIWDLSGNVWEWTNDTITGTNEPHGVPASWNWLEYPSITTWGSMTQSTAGPANAAWNSGNGMGQIYSENATDATVFGFFRGGGWGGGGFAGVGALNLNRAPGYTSSTRIGFRCAR
jgi:formylglycine-generating enzyme required for sulfatase activity